MKDNINLDAIDQYILDKGHTQMDQKRLSSGPYPMTIVELDARQKIFEDVIIQRIKTLQNQVSYNKSSISRMHSPTGEAENPSQAESQIRLMQQVAHDLQYAKDELYQDLQERLYQELRNEMQKFLND